MPPMRLRTTGEFWLYEVIPMKKMRTRSQRKKMIEQLTADPEMKDRVTGVKNRLGCQDDRIADTFIGIAEKVVDRLGGEPDYTGKIKYVLERGDRSSGSVSDVQVALLALEWERDARPVLLRALCPDEAIPLSGRNVMKLGFLFDDRRSAVDNTPTGAAKRIWYALQNGYSIDMRVFDEMCLLSTGVRSPGRMHLMLQSLQAPRA